MSAQTATQIFHVTGMTCGHCVHAVTEELKALQGVTDVDVDLPPEAASSVQVTAERTLTDDEVSDALDEAGAYTLV